MRNYTTIFFCLFIVFITAKCLYSQDNLHLVDTLIGTSANNKLWRAEGIGDFNGDGYADFIVCYEQYIDLYFGNSQFKPQLAHRFYLPPSSYYYTGAAYGIGDVNDDGCSDLMIITGDTSYHPTYSYAEIILGSKNLDTIPKFIFYPPHLYKKLSYNIYPLGDINGDGFNDFAISEYYNWDDGLGRVYIFKGGKVLADTPWVVISGPQGIHDGYFGYSVLGVGDQNNDELADFLISTYDPMQVYLYSSNKDPSDISPTTIYGPYTNISEVKFVGDLNRNGKKDFIISTLDSNYYGKVYIYLGFDSCIVYDMDKSSFGAYISVGGDGDINNDGYDDYMIGNTNYRNNEGFMVGNVRGFWGNNMIDTSAVAFRVEGDNNLFNFGAEADIIGDINGDGYADIFILQPFYCKNNIYNSDSTLGKLNIYSYTKITGINHENINIPKEFKLNQNYPNPFNPTTVITYQLSEPAYVTIRVFNSLGQEITTLVDNKVEYVGIHKVEFEAIKYDLCSGIYFLELNTEKINSNYNEENKEVIKMIYLK